MVLEDGAWWCWSRHRAARARPWRDMMAAMEKSVAQGRIVQLSTSSSIEHVLHTPYNCYIHVYCQLSNYIRTTGILCVSVCLRLQVIIYVNSSCVYMLLRRRRRRRQCWRLVQVLTTTTAAVVAILPPGHHTRALRHEQRRDVLTEWIFRIFWLTFNEITVIWYVCGRRLVDSHSAGADRALLGRCEPSSRLPTRTHTCIHRVCICARTTTTAASRYCKYRSSCICKIIRLCLCARYELK